MKILSIYDIDRKDPSQVREFMESNKGLVYLIADRFTFDELVRDDLIQEGLIGMYNAVMNFDLSTNYAFSSYAYPTIAGTIQNYINRKMDFVTIPLRVKKNYLEYLNLKKEYGENTFEVMNLSEEEEKELIKVLNLNTGRLSMDLGYEEGYIDVSNLVPGDDEEEHILSKLRYEEILDLIEKELGKRGREVALGLEDGLTLRELGSKLNCSRTTIGNIRDRIRKMLIENNIYAA